MKDLKTVVGSSQIAPELENVFAADTRSIDKRKNGISFGK